MKALPFANCDQDVEFAWTHTFPETFRKAYGIDIVEKIPEIIWDLPNNENCPQCGKMLFRKKGKNLLICQDKACGYSREIAAAEDTQNND